MIEGPQIGCGGTRILNVTPAVRGGGVPRAVTDKASV